MLRFCTYFDRNYLSRGLALYGSLRRHCRDFSLTVLTLDEETRVTLHRLALPGVQVVPLETLEAADPELRAVKPLRPTLEYYYTCGPSLLRYLLRSTDDGQLVTYLDADLFFFNDPAPAVAELDGASVGLVSHRFADASATALYGEYNVGWVSFRADADGEAALAWWRARCLESCAADRPETGVCGDQKYLDELPHRFPRVVTIGHSGANLAYWNWRRFQYSVTDGSVFADGVPLLWFHFGDFRVRYRWWVSPSFSGAPRQVRNTILAPYTRAVRQLDRALAPGGAIARRTGVVVVPRLDAVPPAPRPGRWGRLAHAARLGRWIATHVYVPVRAGGRLEPEVAHVLGAADDQPALTSPLRHSG